MNLNIQAVAVGKSRKNISALMDIRPDYANIEREGRLEQVDPNEVAVGLPEKSKRCKSSFPSPGNVPESPDPGGV